MYFYKYDEKEITTYHFTLIKKLMGKKYTHCVAQLENGLVIQGGFMIEMGYLSNDDHYDKHKNFQDYVDVEIDVNEMIKRVKPLISSCYSVDDGEYTRSLQTGEYTPAKKHVSHTCATLLAYALGLKEWRKYDCDKLRESLLKL